MSRIVDVERLDGPASSRRSSGTVVAGGLALLPLWMLAFGGWLVYAGRGDRSRDGE